MKDPSSQFYRAKTKVSPVLDSGDSPVKEIYDLLFLMVDCPMCFPSRSNSTIVSGTGKVRVRTTVVCSVPA